MVMSQDEINTLVNALEEGSFTYKYTLSTPHVVIGSLAFRVTGLSHRNGKVINSSSDTNIRVDPTSIRSSHNTSMRRLMRVKKEKGNPDLALGPVS